MFSQLFGKYLVEKQIITLDEYRASIEKQLSVRVKLGTIAIAEGLLSEEDVDMINKLQMQFDKRFGDIAQEKGLLTDSQRASSEAGQSIYAVHTGFNRMHEADCFRY